MRSNNGNIQHYLQKKCDMAPDIQGARAATTVKLKALGLLVEVEQGFMGQSARLYCMYIYIYVRVFLLGGSDVLSRLWRNGQKSNCCIM